VWQIRRLGGDQVTAAAGASTVDRMGFAGSWTKRDPLAAGQPCVEPTGRTGHFSDALFELIPLAEVGGAR
jgi:hypothetical protein